MEYVQICQTARLLLHPCPFRVSQQAVGQHGPPLQPVIRVSVGDHFAALDQAQCLAAAVDHACGEGVLVVLVQDEGGSIPKSPGDRMLAVTDIFSEKYCND
jgi:hypothetical protein